MRRFVSVFSSKRDKHARNDKDPVPCSSPTVSSAPPMGNLPSKASLSPLAIPLFARNHHSHHTVKSPASSSFSTPHLSSDTSDPSSHSSGSSNDDEASLSVHTPDDAQSLHLARADTKRSWMSWLPKKRSSSLKHRDRKVKAPVKTPLPDWEPLDLPVPPQRLHPVFGASDDDMHTSSVSSFDLLSSADPITAPSQSPTATAPPSPALARANFAVLIRNSVAQSPVHPSPFIHPASGPIYPRSSNRPHLLVSHPSPSLRTLTLKKLLRNRLDDPSSFPLDGATIAALGSRPTPDELFAPLLPDYNIPRPDPSMKILSSSPGVHRWICRPAFEDRFAIFVATEAGAQSKPVSSALAVAALEYSEALDVMVDPDYGLVLDKVLPLVPSESMPPVASPSATVAEPLPVPTIEVSESAPVDLALPRTSSFIIGPSPLRNQHSRDPSEASPVLHEARSMSTISMSTIQGDTTPVKKAAIATPAVKRVVRFAEDDDDEEDDGLPLHLLRQKKKREEKAKFLRVEQQRRMREAFEEQKRQETEALEQERKRLAAQKEREERDKRLYAEKVRASRLRSEQVRAGAYNTNSGSSSSLLVTSPSSAQLREGERNIRSSKLCSSNHGETSSPRTDELSSSGSSRPTSVRHSSHSLVPPTLPEARSRPPSTYSNTSSEDMRPSPGSRRNSYATSASGSIRSSMAVPYPMYPMWTGSHQSLSPMQMQMQMPMVPNNFAAFADMPLLPPNAPFMKQSRQPSPDNKSRRNSSSQSSERGHLNSSGSSSPATSPTSSKNQQWPNHRRQGSGDSKASSRSSKMYPQHTGGSSSQQRPQPTSTQSQPHLPRGRPPIPNFSSTPSPWTAMPSQNGMLPTAMPASPYSHSMPARTRNGAYSGQMGHDWRSSLIT